MKNLYKILFILTLSVSVLSSCCDSNISKFYGFDTPTDSAIVFAPGIICLEDRFEQSITFMPDGSKLVFGVSNQLWDDFKMYSISYINDKWSNQKEVFANGLHGGIAPMFSPDGSKLYHIATRTGYPEMDVYYTYSVDTGWVEAKKMDFPVSSDSIEWEASESIDKTVFFSSNREGCDGPLDIFFSEFEDGMYKKVQRMSEMINSSSGDDCPFIAPDKSYLIFASDRKSGHGNRDLYVSFRKLDGSWSKAKNLGSKINTNYWELYPSVSPDGKYLFFTRREKWLESAPSDIYWVSADVFESLKSD